MPSLGVAQPGVYPLLVNANGTPDYGAPARLDDARFLLPVIGVPPEPAAAPAADALSDVVAPDTTKPVRLTMMWPLGDRPRLAAGAPGGTTPVRLIDDELAGSISAGGRLDALLSAVDFATSQSVDPSGQVRSALCLAVDPDLLVTVNAMTSGYVVDDGPDIGPSTPTHPGAGQDAAVNWLNRLRTVAQRMCVAPANYAQADLDALQRVGDAGLSSIATNGAGDIVDQILGISSTRGATLVGDGPLTAPAIQLLSSQGPTVAVGRGQSRRTRFGDGGIGHRRRRPGPLFAGSGCRSVRPHRRRCPGRPRAPIRGRRRISIPRWTFRSSTTRQWRVARTHWVLCSGAGLRPQAEPRSQIADAADGMEPAGRRRRGRSSPRWPPPSARVSPSRAH